MSDHQQRDPTLEKLYQASREEQPSAQTDAAIKRLAREGLRPRTPWYRGSAWAVAASLVLGVAVLLQWPEPLVEEPPAPSSAPPVGFDERRPEGWFKADDAASLESKRREPNLPARAPALQEEMAKGREGMSTLQSAAPVDCEDELPERLDDPAAWQLRIEQLIDAGESAQAECLRQRYDQRFGRPDEQ